MINSLCGSMGTQRSESSMSENSTSKQQPTSPTASVSESNVVASLEFNQSGQNPSILSLQSLKFEDLDVEVQSPDNFIWESLFGDQFDQPGTDFMISSPKRWDFMISSPKRGDYMISSPKRGDFMISSPKRGDFMVSSPKRTSFSNTYASYVHGHSLLGGSSPSASGNSTHMGSFSTVTHKGKVPSPLHRVINSPHSLQPETLMLPSLDALLEECYRDGFEADHPTMKTSCLECLPEGLDLPVTIPAMLECLQPMGAGPAGLVMSEETDVYQLDSYGTAQSDQLSQSSSSSQLQQQMLQLPHQLESIDHGLVVGPSGVSEQEQDSGLQLVHLLLACAEAVAKDDYMLARRYLHHLNRVVTPLGDSMQRVASCFTDALSARLNAALTTSTAASTPKPFTSFPPNSIEILKIYQILYQACPYIKFAHFTANQAIFEAFEAEERVHVIDLDILQGYQWPAFMHALAARGSGAPFLRLTGVGFPLEAVRETGRRLADLAQSLNLPFEFHPVGEQLEDIQPQMFQRRVGEALAVNSVNRLHHVPANHLGNLIGMVRDQAPNIVTIVEQEASHNGPYFLGRFLEALHYYSAIFDSLDATFPTDSPERAKLEQYIFAAEIMNIVACEGAERVERHERLEKWRKMMEGKGFKGVGLSANAVTQSKILLGLYPCDGYRLTEDRGSLLLGWQDRAIIAASAWRC